MNEIMEMLGQEEYERLELLEQESEGEDKQ